MKKKVIFSLLVLLIIFVSGASISVYLMNRTGNELQRIFKMFGVEKVRKTLIDEFQHMQIELYSLNTPLDSRYAAIEQNLIKLHQASETCTSCHHSPDVEELIVGIQNRIYDYEDRISYLIKSDMDLEEFYAYKADTSSFGEDVISEVMEISHGASAKLNYDALYAIRDLKHVRYIILISISIGFLLSVFIAARLIRGVTGPIDTLVNATRKISRGLYGSTISINDETEFGELAYYFNKMSIAIKNSYDTIHQEIKDRRAAESALMKSEKFLSIIFDSIRDPFCIFDKDYRIIRANEAYSELKKRKLSELYGSRCHEVIYGIESKCSNCIVHTSFRSHDPCAKEKLITLEDGTSIWFDIFTYPIYDECGNVSHVIEYVRDISERKRYEKELKESKERYELAAKGANDGLWDWNLKTDSIYYSPRWKYMIGYSVEEIKETPEEWFSRIHPDDLNSVRITLENHLNGHSQHYEVEHRILHKDGAYRWVQVRGLAVRDIHGKSYRIAGSMTDITHRKESEKQLMFDALHDALTGLPNRILFMDRLRHAIDRDKRNKDYLFAVLFMDIDRFKVLNDSMGHVVGDELLRSVSRRLEECLRLGDTVARFGGDEFAILLEDLKNQDEAIHVAERIREKLSHAFHLNGQDVFASASIGIVFNSVGYDHPEHLLRNADIAMYRAKAERTSGYQVFNNEMYGDVVARLELETDIRLASKQDEFLLHYQPIVASSSGKIIGLESLIRWQHPIHGVIYPNHFINVAEDTGLIFDIGGWVLSESCRQLSEWQRRHPELSDLTMSVNISSRQVFPSLIDTIKTILVTTGLNPKNLILEITESMIMENAEIVVPVLMRLKDMNIKLYIDDFGTGYSSLGSLHDMPVDVLKIDRSFVSRIDKNNGGLEIIRAVISMADSLNLDIIAEGVENKGQMIKLQQMGCEYMQGYLFSKPLAPSQAEQVLKQGSIDPLKSESRAVAIQQ